MPSIVHSKLSKKGTVTILVGHQKPSLFPAYDLREKELRNVSVLFRLFELVPTLARDIFGEIGVNVGKRVKAKYLTEVVFEDFECDRPDGYVAINNWQALIEAKCDANSLDKDQVNRYVSIAKHHKLDAVITISNEMVARPDHHPCYRLTKSEVKRLSLYHFSWQHIFTRLCLWAERDDEIDSEQQALLMDFRNFLSSKASGLRRFDQMGRSWKPLLRDIGRLATSETLPSKNQDVRSVVRDWFFEERDLALKLSEQLKVPVKLSIPRKYLGGNKSEERLHAVSKEMAQHLYLETKLIIPGAADNLCLRANLAHRKIEASMKLKAKQDSLTTKGRVGWLKNMLKNIEIEYRETTFVIFRWAGKRDPLIYSVDEIFQWKKVPADFPPSPVTNFEIRMITDNTSAFQSPSKFIGELEHLASVFYWQVGERLKKWVPNPPRLDQVIEPESIKKTRY